MASNLDINAYNVPSQDLGPPDLTPYDPMQSVNQGAQRYLQQYAPALPTFAPPVATDPNVAPPTGGKKLWDTQLEALIQAKNGKPTPEDFDKLAEGFKIHVTPLLYQQKGVSEKEVEAGLADFDAKAARDKARLFPEAAAAEAAAAAGGGKDNANPVTENIYALGTGVAKILPGAMNLADLAYRGVRGIPGIHVNPGQQDKPWYQKEYGLPLGNETALGHAGDDMSAGLDHFLDRHTSSETRAQYADIQAQLKAKGVPDSKMAGYMDTLMQYLDPHHYRALAMQVSGGASSFIPIGATAKLLSKAGEVAKAAEIAGKAAEAAGTVSKVGLGARAVAKVGERYNKLGEEAKILASGTPLAATASGTAMSDFEHRVKTTPIEQLLKDRPDFVPLYNGAIASGLSKDAAAATVKQHIFEQGVAGVGATNFLANAVLPALPFLHGTTGAAVRMFGGKAERVAGDAVKAVSRRMNALKTGASEFGEETLAGAIQDTGQNQALGRPAYEGAGSQAAIGGLAGFFSGGTIGAMESAASRGVAPGKTDPLKRPNRGAKDTTLGAATPAAPAPGSTVLDPYAGAPATGIAPTAFTVMADAFASSLAEDASAKSLTKYKSKDPNQIIPIAKREAQRRAGDTWDTLSTEQRVDLTEKVATAIGSNNGAKGLGEALVAHKAAVLTPAAAAAPITETGTVSPADAAAAAAAVAPAATPGEATPLPDNFADLDKQEQVALLRTKTTAEGKPITVDEIQTLTGVEPDEATNIARAVNVQFRPKAATPAERTATTAANRARLINEFGFTDESLNNETLGVDDLLKNELIKQKTAADKAAQAKKQGKKKTKPTKPNENAYLDDYLSAILDKPNNNDALVRADPHFAAAKAAQAAGTITDTASLNQFLTNASQAAQGVPLTSTKHDNTLVGHILKSAKKGDALAKDEAKSLVAMLKGSVDRADIDRMTLAQLRDTEHRINVRERIAPTPTPKKGVKKATPALVQTKKSVKKQTPASAEQKQDPKPQAPAADAGAQAQTNPSPSVKPKESKPALTVKQQIQKRFLNLRPSVVNPLIAAVEDGQNGQTAAMHAAIKDALDAEFINQDDAKFLRGLAQTKPHDARTALEEEIKQILEEAALGSEEDLQPRRPESETNNPNFERWSHGNDVVPLDEGDTYDGGPVVFTALHATTYGNIETINPNQGNTDGYLGQGFYLTTNPDDAAANYAGEGPDLLNRIDFRSDEIVEAASDNEEYAQDLVTSYAKAHRIRRRNRTMQEFIDRYIGEAAAWEARNQLKGDNAGTVYKLYTRLDKPFVAVNGISPNLTPRETLKLIKSATKIGKQWDMTEPDLANLRNHILDNGYDLTHKDFDNAIRDDVTIDYSDEGNRRGAGQFLQEVLRDTGLFDGMVMNAHEKFGPKNFHGRMTKGMAGLKPGTLHIMPFNAVQVKSAISNNGNYSDEDTHTQHARPTPTQIAKYTQLALQTEEAMGTQPSQSTNASEDTGPMTPEELAAAYDGGNDTVSGLENIKAKLRALRATPKLRAAADFALWLLDGNPQVARILNLRTAAIESAGGYNPLKLLVTINNSDADVTTIVHEIMHHLERMLPTALQQKIRVEWAARLNNKIAQVTAAGRTTELKYLQAVLQNIRNPTEENRLAALHYVNTTIEKGGVDPVEFYKYFNASEYWAEEASRILSERQKDNSWKAQLKEWFTNFVEKFKQVFGQDNKHTEIYNGLKAALGKGEGNYKLGSQIRLGSLKDIDLKTKKPKQVTVNNDDAAPETIRDLGDKVSTFDRFIEVAANNVLGLENFDIQLNRLGVETAFEDTATAAHSRYSSDVSFFNEQDRSEKLNPAKDWMQKNFSRFNTNFSGFIDKLNVYFGNQNFLERLKTEWIHKVELADGMEVDRQDALEAWRDGKASGAATRAILTRLANDHAISDLRDFSTVGEDKLSEATFDAIEGTLDELAFEHDIHDDSMEELNTLLDGVRERITERRVEAGQVTNDDKWVDLYGWKYYVPLKSAPKNSDAMLKADRTPAGRISIKQLSKQIVVMEGRTTFAHKPFEQLFVDLAQSGERAAKRHFLEKLYNLVVENKKALKATIQPWLGTPKEGYTNKDILNSDGSLKVHKDGIPTKVNSFIYNDGDKHYVVQLPGDSQLIRALAGMNSVVKPGIALKLLSIPTNTLARLYTTLSPFWQLAKGFVRDITTLPATIAVENFDNPMQAASFVAQYAIEMAQIYRAIPTIWNTFTGDTVALKAMAEANPDSYAADLYRYLEAGGSNNFTQGFDIATADKLFKGAYKTADGTWDVAKVSASKVLEYTGNFANFLEQLTRVAAFKALQTSTGASDTEAALKTRRVLDYSKTGTHGRWMNSWLAFFRVGMTSLDTFRRAFRKPMGGFDVKKFAIWSSTMAGLGAIGYLVAAGAMGDDEEKDKDGKIVKVPRIRKISTGNLTQKLFFGAGEKVYGVELGLGVPQMMMAPGILAAALSQGNITEAQAAGEMWNVLQRNGPLRLAGMRGGISNAAKDPMEFLAATAFAFTPTAFAPLVTKDRNLDPFDRPIHKEMYDPSKPKYAQARTTTSKHFVDIARLLYDKTGVDMYPEDIKHLAVDYGGQNVSDLFKATVDISAQNAIGIDAHYNPLTSRFEMKDLEYYDQNDMYDTLTEVGKVKLKYGKMLFDVASDSQAKTKDAADREAKAAVAAELAKNPKEKAVIDAGKTLSGLVTKRSKELKDLARNKMLSDARKQVLRKELDSKTRKATLAVKAALEKNK